MLTPSLLPGTPAPPFELANHRGEPRSLADYTLLGSLLLAFHRGTW
jgi:peroxiredoxin